MSAEYGQINLRSRAGSACQRGGNLASLYYVGVVGLECKLPGKETFR